MAIKKSKFVPDAPPPVHVWSERPQGGQTSQGKGDKSDGDVKADPYLLNSSDYFRSGVSMGVAMPGGVPVQVSGAGLSQLDIAIADAAKEDFFGDAHGEPIYLYQDEKEKVVVVQGPPIPRQPVPYRPCP